MFRLLCTSLILFSLAVQASGNQPNIIWIIAEDQSDHFGSYGETLAKTPHVDRLSAEGAKFTRAFVTAPVCSPSRSAIITGMYQTSIGAHNHRSGRGERKIHLPTMVRPIPEILREAGYYVSNGRMQTDASIAKGKTDYNFVYSPDLYDGADWSGRTEGQPFFAQVHLRGGKFRNQKTLEPISNVQTIGIDPEEVTLPPYYPDHPELRKDWAQYLESIEHVDWEVGQVMDRLKREGIEQNTIVFFLTDHGVSHARGKQFLSDEGTKIPLIVHAPGRIEPGLVREDLVAHIDITASTLDFAGLEVPSGMEGRPLFGEHAQPREYVVSARDRCDETVEHMRSVRTKRYKYIRNYLPELPHLQANRYKDSKMIIQTLHELHEQGRLSAEIDHMFFARRPREELYDLQEDRWEMKNLAVDPAHRGTLVQLRGTLDEWIRETGDIGQKLESEPAYDSDMTVYLRGNKGVQQEILKRNIMSIKSWMVNHPDTAKE